MFPVHDIRETRVYQEAREEGIAQERQRSVSKLAGQKFSAPQIADMLGLDVDLVRKAMAETK